VAVAELLTEHIKDPKRARQGDVAEQVDPIVKTVGLVRTTLKSVSEEDATGRVEDPIQSRFPVVGLTTNWPHWAAAIPEKKTMTSSVRKSLPIQPPILAEKAAPGVYW
jgi:hypothetical protein